MVVLGVTALRDGMNLVASGRCDADRCERWPKDESSPEEDG
jgi:hypothetical protein